MTQFFALNICAFFGVQFLSFPISMTEKSFSQILMTFPGPNTIVAGLEKANFKTRPGWLGFVPEKYPHFLGCRSYRFPLQL